MDSIEDLSDCCIGVIYNDFAKECRLCELPGYLKLYIDTYGSIDSEMGEVTLKELTRRIGLVLDKLAEKDREVLDKFYIDGCSFAVIDNEVGIRGYARKYVQRAIKLMRNPASRVILTTGRHAEMDCISENDYIDLLGLSSRTMTLLSKLSLYRVGDLLNKVLNSDPVLISRLSPKARIEVADKLAGCGYEIPENFRKGKPRSDLNFGLFGLATTELV